jgi:uncharacterized protein
MIATLVVIGNIVYALALIVGVVMTLVSLPGTLVILGSTVIYSACTHWQHPPWWVLLILVAVTLIAETADNLLSFTETKRRGGSSKTGLWAMVGGFLGVIAGGWISPLLGALGLTGGVVGIIFGVLIPPVVCGLIGGYLGGYYYELRQGKSKEEAARAGKGALLGRLQGTLAKTLAAGVMIALIISTVRG